MADKMSWFNPHIKYPRTYHAPWSEGATSDDKKVSSMDHFIGKRVIVTEKMDGENTTFHAKSMNARSLDGLHHVSRDWVKKLWSGIRHEIPDEWRICGENVYAVHSIAYAALDSYFLGFSIWDEFNYALSWEETVGYFDILGIKPVPVLYDGIYDEAKIRALFSESNRETMEGYVIRLAERFHFVSFHVSVAKVVRKNHVTTSDHWKNQQVVPNGLK
jgi:ATP-dependent RNA circularization protein (DNA/RNA ligase family)